MRTDTATFRNRIFKMTRALGVNSVRSKQLTRQIVAGVRYGNYDRTALPALPELTRIDSIELELDVRGPQNQVVVVRINGVFHFCTSTADRIIFNTEPTARQLKISDLLGTLLDQVYDAIADLGHESPEVTSLNARYDALRAESLAINPWVDGALIDPGMAGIYSDCYKDRHGFRPRGYSTYGQMNAFLEPLRVPANDIDDVAQAA